LQPNPSTYILIVTRGHRDDMRVLAWAVKTDARYLGMIGSKRKVLSVYQALEREGFAPELFDRVNAPVGLEIGALTPEEIAISIAAELISVRRGAASVKHKAVVRKDDEKPGQKQAVQSAEAKAAEAKAAAESVSR
jgi:xanthine dehydrogenase accessory factor